LSERAKQSADRIREEIPIIRVLALYQFEVDPRGEDREQQFSCTMHGDGTDNKPSARVYPDSNQFFCFACGTSRDSIALVREKENIGFWDAIRLLEKEFGLDPLPWSAEAEDRPATPAEAVRAALTPSETPEQSLHRLHRFLDGLTRERTLPAQRTAGLWEAYDRVQVYLDEDGDPYKAVVFAHKVLAAAKEALKPSES
jgi:hypothetical protein